MIGLTLDWLNLKQMLDAKQGQSGLKYRGTSLSGCKQGMSHKDTRKAAIGQVCFEQTVILIYLEPDQQCHSGFVIDHHQAAAHEFSDGLNSNALYVKCPLRLVHGRLELEAKVEVGF